MAIRTYKVTLDSKNYIAPEPVYLRQGDKTGAVVIDATLMDNGSPVSLSGLTPMFKANTADGQAVIADSTGFNIINASGGEFTYQVPSQLGSVDGKIKIAYFSFSDSSGAQSTFNVVFVVKKAADMTQESAKDWVSSLSEIIEQYNQWVNNAHSSWQDFVNENKEIIESIDPGGTLLTEVIAARKPELSEPFDSLGLRLNDMDDNADKQSALLTDHSQNLLRINDPSSINKMKVLFNVKGLDGGVGFGNQSTSIDDKTGDIYIIAVNLDFTATKIMHYTKDGKFIDEKKIGYTTDMWPEGDSLYRNSDDQVCFILPADTNGNWFNYNYETGTKSSSYKLSGTIVYCIEPDLKYFVTMQTGYTNNAIAAPVRGFNVYDLDSLTKGTPTYIKFIPTNTNMIQRGNKIQGFQMIGNQIYIGRGGRGQWFRTTIISADSGLILGDYHWLNEDVWDLLGISDVGNIESEGVTHTVIDGVMVSVLSVLNVLNNGDVWCGLLQLNASDGTEIRYDSGTNVASMTDRNPIGDLHGFTIELEATGPSLLDCVMNIKEKGVYPFITLAGNPGLWYGMPTIQGAIIVRAVENGVPIKVTITGVDTNGVTWTNVFDGGWRTWRKHDSYTVLFSGSSEAITPINLISPPKLYSKIEVSFATENGNRGIGVGTKSIVELYYLNVGDGDSSAALVTGEAYMQFTDTTAQLVNRQTLSLASSGNPTNGAANIALSAPRKIYINEIRGYL